MRIDDLVIALIIGGISFGGIRALLIVVKAWAKRMEGGGRSVDSGEIEDLREHLTRLNGDVAELQERLDFAERMLAQQREPDRLKGER
jgi:hypothetical protein